MNRRWILWLLIVAAVWVGVGRLTEIETLVEALGGAQWTWVLAAGALQAGYYLLLAGLHWSAFETVGVRSRTRELLPVWFASLFVNLAARSAGPALFVDYAARRGEPAARAAAGMLLVRVTDFGSFAAILIVGLAYLCRYHDLHSYELMGAAALLLLTVGHAALLSLGLWQAERLRRLLVRVQAMGDVLARRLHRPPPFPTGWAGRNAAEFAAAAQAIRGRPARVWRTLLVALAAHVVDLLTLSALFLAFRQPVGLGTLVAGFAVGVLFWIISITPEGVGVVEGMMTLVYTSLGVPAGRAALVALAFRGMSFWFPMALGFFFLHRAPSFRVAEPECQGAEGRRILT